MPDHHCSRGERPASRVDRAVVSAVALRLCIAAAMAGAIYLWLTGPFEGPRTYRIPLTVVLLGGVALLAERTISDPYAAALVRLAGAIGVTGITAAMFLLRY